MKNELGFGISIHALWIIPTFCGVAVARVAGFDEWWQILSFVAVSFAVFRAHHFAHQTLDKIAAEKNDPL